MDRFDGSGGCSEREVNDGIGFQNCNDIHSGTDEDKRHSSDERVSPSPEKYVNVARNAFTIYRTPTNPRASSLFCQPMLYLRLD